MQRGMANQLQLSFSTTNCALCHPSDVWSVGPREVAISVSRVTDNNNQLTTKINSKENIVVLFVFQFNKKAL